MFGDPRDVIESRLLLEPITTRLAAERISPPQVAALGTLIAEVERDAERGVLSPSPLGLQFHAQLATCCGNTMMAGVVEQLVNIEKHPLWRLVNEQALRVPGARESQRNEHKAILEAVAAGDAALAESTMRAHLDELQRYIFAPSNSLAMVSDLSGVNGSAGSRSPK
jgi:DNA-binding GntR family transcriptional regulator